MRNREDKLYIILYGAGGPFFIVQFSNEAEGHIKYVMGPAFGPRAGLWTPLVYGYCIALTCLYHELPTISIENNIFPL